MKQYLEKLKG